MPTTATAAPPVPDPQRDPGSRAATRLFCVLAAFADLVPGPHPLVEITARPRWGAAQRGRPRPGLGRPPRARRLERVAPHPAPPACAAAGPGRRPELAGLPAAHDPAIDAPRSVRPGAAGHVVPWMAAAQAGRVLPQRAPATRGAVFREPLRERPESIRARGYAVSRVRERFTTLASLILSAGAAADAQRGLAALARHLTTHAACLQSVLAAPSRALAA